MPSIRWSLVKPPLREMPRMPAPPSFKPRTWACRDSRRGGIGKWLLYVVFPKFDWFLETSKTEKLVKKSDKT